MNLQTELIQNKDWDILIILDACRYDAFKHYCWDYLGEGWLRKLTSPSSWTGGWLQRTFNKSDMKDTIYISANPYVNSKDVITPFKGKKIFKRIVDVWDGGFGNLRCYLVPEEVTKCAFVTMDLNRKSKFIIHYMQPHVPYYIYNDIKQNGKKNVLRDFTQRILGEDIIWTIAEKLNFPAKDYMEIIRREEGDDGIVYGYETNLMNVLESVRKLIDKYPNKKIVVTADHGERLGENGRYGHGGIRDKIVSTIPWFEVNNESS